VQPSAKPSAVLAKAADVKPVATELEACAAPAKALQFEQHCEASSTSTASAAAAVTPISEAAVVSDDEDTVYTTIRSPTECYHGSRSPDIMMMSLLHVIELELARNGHSDSSNGCSSSSTDMDTDYSSSASEGSPTYTSNNASTFTPMRHSSHFCAPH
jgi:hypothetical protein